MFDFEAHDKQNSAVHEAAHALVAWHYGIHADARIFRNPTCSDPMNERTWIGRVRIWTPDVSRLRERRICIAGMVAEWMNGREFCDEYELLDHLLCSYGDSPESSEGWSSSDWDGAAGWTKTDVHAVFAILKRKWAGLQREAGYLKSAAA